ncbi:hypothetical protein [Candidatus Epulonipiscium viviparus]|uniref:hypothetical protein n=1 Tax=Candidatus Epulonipiscium viviparus TaxID=420336 RepID=UPI0027380495|nr:hypothetical protein [Candidatus Epulopiscium viviparus]
MKQPEHVESEFCKSLTEITRILETPLYRVWGCAPIYGEDGHVHVFYSRWVHKYAKPVGWVVSCEIAHEDEIIIAGALANEEYSGFYQVTATTTTMPRVKLSTLPEWIDIRLSRNNTEDDWEVATHNTIDGVMVTFNRIDFCDIYRSDQPRANYIKIATR